MASLAVPDFGGAWVPDTGGDEGGGQGHPPPGLADLLEKFGTNGVVISGVVTWIGAQVDTQTSDACNSLAMRCFQEGEVTAAKDALKGARGKELESLVIDFKKNRQGLGKKEKEIDDIKDAIVALKAAGKMPLILASSDQMVSCPQSWGVPATATVQDVMGRVIMLEKVMADNMQNQKEHMELLRQEVIVPRRQEPRTPSFPDIMVTSDTPSKKRKIEEGAQNTTYAGAAAAVNGVQPLGTPQQKGIQLLKSMLITGQQVPPQQKPQRNIC